MFDTEEAVRNVTEDVVSAPWEAVEVRRVCWSRCQQGSLGRCRRVRTAFVLQVMVFPELAFRHEGYLTVLEFATQELRQPVQVRFQVHRPIDGEGETAPLDTCRIVRADTIRALSNQVRVAFCGPSVLRAEALKPYRLRDLVLFFAETRVQNLWARLDSPRLAWRSAYPGEINRGKNLSQCVEKI